MNQLLVNWLTLTVTDAYSPFGTIGSAALKMVAARRRVGLSEENKHQLLDRMQELPPHPEVDEGLSRLRRAGMRLAAPSNSTQQVAEAQLENAGLQGHFERVLSGDDTKLLKSAAGPYRAAATILGVESGQIRLVATRAWDVASAQSAGCAAAFVARRGMVLDPLVQRPDVVGANLDEVAEQNIELEIG